MLEKEGYFEKKRSGSFGNVVYQQLRRSNFPLLQRSRMNSETALSHSAFFRREQGVWHNAGILNKLLKWIDCSNA